MTTKSRHSWLRCEQCMLKSVMLKCFSSGFSLHVQSEIPGAWPISTKSSLSFLRLLNFATKGQKFSAISTCSIWRSVMLLSSVKLRSLNIGWWWKSLSSRRLVNSGKAIGASAKMLLWIIPIRPSSLRDKSCMFLMSANSWPISSNPVTIFAVKLFSIVDLSLAKSVRSAWPMTSLNPTALRFYLKPFATICNYLKSFETIWNYLQLFETIWNYLQRFEKIWNYLHLFEIIWNDLKPFEIVAINLPEKQRSQTRTLLMNVATTEATGVRRDDDKRLVDNETLTGTISGFSMTLCHCTPSKSAACDVTFSRKPLR